MTPPQADSGQAGPTATISLKPWDPETPYLKRIKDARSAGPGAAYAAYLTERAEYSQAPSFFLDVASFLFREAGQAATSEEASVLRRLGTRVLSSVCELGVEDPQLLRLVGYGLEAGGRLTLAEEVFRDVLRLRPEEPQSHRDLANVLARRWKARYFPEGDCESCSDEGSGAAYSDEAARRDARQSFELWQAVLRGKWDDRFLEIELVCLMEMSAALAFARAAEPLRPVADEVEEGFVKLGHPEFGRTLPCGMRISMAWDTNDTDIDLHVREPSGEEAYYGHRLTSIGGLVSRDFTSGYGPEEYVLREGMSGTYGVSAKFYASNRQDLSGATTILLSFFTNFGVPGRERRGLITLRLESNKESIHVGDIEMVSPAWEAARSIAEAKLWAEATLEQWRSSAEAAAPTLQRWWRLQRLLQPLSLQPPPRMRRERFRMLKLFGNWDLSAGGFIKRDTLVKVLRDVGVPVAEEDLRAMLELQCESSGNVNYQGFIQWLFSRAARAGPTTGEEEE